MLTSFHLELKKAHQEFQQKQQTLTTGYLVLLDQQVLHFTERKEWEQVKDNYPRHVHQFAAVDLAAWHHWAATKQSCLTK